MATIREPGWISALDAIQRQVLEGALLGLYKQGGVDLGRRIRRLLPEPTPAYDIDDLGLTVWPNSDFRETLHYEIDDHREYFPRPAPPGKNPSISALDADQLLISRMPLLWESWVNWWRNVDGKVGSIPLCCEHFPGFFRRR